MKQAKNVMIIFYDDSFITLIDILKPYKYAYILHDCDKEEDGTLKKPHWHLLLSFEAKKSLSLIANVFNVKENLIEVVKNYKALERYLIHLDNFDKYQYDVNKVIANYDYKIQVYSTSESILKFLIDKCEEYTSIKEFNLMVMKLGIDYMKIYKNYYSMIKDVIYYNNNERIKSIQEIEQNRRSLVNEYSDSELLDIYHKLMINDKKGYNPSFAQKIINKCIEKGLIACEGLIIDNDVKELLQKQEVNEKE